MKVCPSCGKEFEPENKRQNYCSIHCRTYKYHKICEICGKEFLAENNKTKLCSKECMNINRINNMNNIKKKMKQTCMKKYGIENVMKLDEKKEKLKKTNLEKYGVDNPMKDVNIQNKLKQTNLEKFGVENPMLNKDVLEKRFQTNLKKYGSKSPYGSKRVQEKIIQNNLKRYGVEYANQDPIIRNKIQQTNLERYGSISPCGNKEVQEKIRQTNLEKYGVPYYVMTKDYKTKKGNVISNLNKRLGDFFNINEDDYEFTLNRYSYDLKKDNVLIEIDPTVTHNSIYSYTYFIGVTKDNQPLDKNYHKLKSQVAIENGYKCIHIFDWDDLDKIKYMLQDKEILYARKLEVKKVNKKDCDKFLNDYHLQNTCNNQSIRYGLYKDNELIEVMTFGKPRYNKNYEYELLRLCTKSTYKIVGGAEKLFKHFIEEYRPKSIISYCDNSKFSGDVYERLGFKLKNKSNPSAHWYNMKTGRHITDNLLRQRGFSQLHNDSNYIQAKKGDSNEELMINAGYLKVYDCGQSTFIYENK